MKIEPRGEALLEDACADSSNGNGDPPRRPRGRPPGSKNKRRIFGLTDSERIALEESRRVLQKEQGLTATHVVNRAQLKTAIKGGTNAQKAHLERIAKLEQKQSDAEEKYLTDLEWYVRLCEETLRNTSGEVKARLEQMMLPHPADVEVDFAKRTVRINGPASTFERREWDDLKRGLFLIRQYLLEMREDLEVNPSDASLQTTYTYMISRYLDACELFPERHRPERLPEWTWYKNNVDLIGPAAGNAEGR